jgi:preprotein translocase subunit SecA
VLERILKIANETQAARVARIGPDMFRRIEKAVLLQTLDALWREHLVTLDHLRQVIGWRGYAQRDPLNEYKSEAFELFSALLARLRENVTGQLMRVEVVQEPETPELPEMQMLHASANPSLEDTPARELPRGTIRNARREDTKLDPKAPNTWGKVGRNDSCPCGSGKKYKQCHGKLS